jgi:uncharacterized protein
MAAFIEQYDIMFKGLKTGVHCFNFSLDNRFFGFFENPATKGGDIKVGVELDKKSDFLALSLRFSGKVKVECDRCLDEFDLWLDFVNTLYVKSGEEGVEKDADIIFLEPNEYKVNLAEYFIESILLNLPVKKVHENRENGTDSCNIEMINKIREHSVNEKSGKTDPRWDRLKDMIK